MALRETFLGWDGDRIEDIWQHAYRSRFYRGGPVLMVNMIVFGVVYARLPNLLSPVCPVWFGHCLVGHQRQEARSTNLAVARRKSERPHQGVWLDRR